MSSPFDITCSEPHIALPNETLLAIFNDLPTTSITALALVSHRFNSLAEWILYSSIYITDVLTESSPTPSKTLRWCESMQRRRHLIDALRKLHIRWQASDWIPPPHTFLDVCESVANIVRQLTPLESLELFLGPANSLALTSEPIHAIERIIRGCHFTQLQSCSLGADWMKGTPPYTSILSSFLASIPTLRHLKLADHHSSLAISTEALPCLSSFRGSADTAASLLPGRPVQFLSLIGHDSDVNRENFPRMTFTSMPLRYLDLSAMSVRPVLLRNVSTFLPNLESLRVRLALRHTLHYSFSGIRILTGLSAVLSAFHQLTCLDLSPTEVGGIGRADVTEELSVCNEWSRACPSLRRIIFPSETEWVLHAESGWYPLQE